MLIYEVVSMWSLDLLEISAKSTQMSEEQKKIGNFSVKLKKK